MNKTLLTALLLAPGLALAKGPCTVERTQSFDLDTAGIAVLQVSIGPDQLRLDGHDGDSGQLTVRMCASDQARLDALGAAIERRGDDRLVLELDHGGRSNRISTGWFSSRSDYGRFEIQGRIPAHMAVDLTVGSGDAEVNNVAALEAVVGSGDLEANHITGLFKGQVGSGDIEVEGAGRVEIGNIGSGDISIDGVQGDAVVGNIGSGDLSLRGVTGSVRIGAIGSGDAKLRDVAGSVEVRALGSGDIDARDIGGDLTLRSKGSGRVNHRNVGGTVSVPNR